MFPWLLMEQPSSFPEGFLLGPAGRRVRGRFSAPRAPGSTSLCVRMCEVRAAHAVTGRSLLARPALSVCEVLSGTGQGAGPRVTRAQEPEQDASEKRTDLTLPSGSCPEASAQCPLGLGASLLLSPDSPLVTGCAASRPGLDPSP